MALAKAQTVSPDHRATTPLGQGMAATLRAKAEAQPVLSVAALRALYNPHGITLSSVRADLATAYAKTEAVPTFDLQAHSRTLADAVSADADDDFLSPALKATDPQTARWHDMLRLAELQKQPGLLIHSSRHRDVFCRWQHEWRTCGTARRRRILGLLLRPLWSGTKSKGGRKRTPHPNEVIVLRSLSAVHAYVIGLRALVHERVLNGPRALLQVFPEAEELTSPLPPVRNANLLRRKRHQVTLEELGDRKVRVPVDGLAILFVCRCLKLSRSQLYKFIPGLSGRAHHT